MLRVTTIPDRRVPYDLLRHVATGAMQGAEPPHQVAAIDRNHLGATQLTQQPLGRFIG
jgi:hypothetical protein